MNINFFLFTNFDKNAENLKSVFFIQKFIKGRECCQTSGKGRNRGGHFDRAK